MSSNCCVWLLAALSTSCTVDIGGPETDEQEARRLPGTMTAAPNPVPSGGASYTITGQGFIAGAAITLEISDPACCDRVELTAAADGSMSFQGTTGAPGTYTYRAFQTQKRRQKLMAE